MITGATSGIGYEMADRLARRGYDLVLASRNLERMNEIRDRFAESGTQVVAIQVDLTGIEAARFLYDEITRRGFAIDVLVNNAGFGVWGDHVEQDPQRVEQMLGLNVVALTTLCGLFGKDMKQRGRGYILNVASGAAYQPMPRIAAYGASKAYVLNFSEALAKELEDYGVSVTVLSPGATDTGFFDAAGMEVSEAGPMSKKFRMSAGTVAQIGLDAMFDRRLSVIPGFLNNLLAFSVRLAPRSVVAAIVKRLADSVTADSA